jgi:DNA mismatch repair protein MutS2
MDRQSLRVLDFPQIRLFLQSLALTEPGRQAAARVHPSTDRQQIEVWLGQVSELKEYLHIGGSLPLAGAETLAELLDRVRQSGHLLTPEELLTVSATLGVTRRLAELSDACRPDYPRLAELLGNLQAIPGLEAEIEQSVDPRGRIRDGASPELSRLRREIGELRERLHEELGEILEHQAARGSLQEKLLSVRNDRLVIPLRSDARRAVDGIVHDTSHSGATLFVEPFAVVALNNRLSRVRSREREEEARILRQLTDGVMSAATLLRSNEKWLGAVDCVHAKVRLSSLLAAREPVLNDGVRIHLKQALHPLLVLQQRAQDPSGLPAGLWEQVVDTGAGEVVKGAGIGVVPVDLQLDEERRTLIISGANTGGKTVSLKTLGLLGLMVQAGMHVPVAEGSEWPVLAGIFAEIGDEQDVRAHLSTFSARIQRLVTMLRQAERDSLVVLDELGTGTDPAEGAALALAVLDELRRREPFIAVTTHYHLLKVYGVLQDGVENVAVLFDSETGRPTYRLGYGHPGTSNALEIAADLGMPPTLIETASTYLGRDERRAIELIRQLEETCRKAGAEEQRLRSERRQMELSRAELDRDRAELMGSREEILSEAREKVQRLLREAEAELKSAIARFQQQGMKGAAEARRKVEQIREELGNALASRDRPRTDPLSDDAAGQMVRLRGMAGSGTLLKVKDQGRRAEVQLGSKRVEVDTDAVELLAVHQSGGRNVLGHDGIRIFREESETCEQRLHLLGMRVDEALALLDKTLDRAILSGCRELHVVHGHGSGRLRRAVQGFLAEHAAVSGFHHEQADRGGTGVTVVELKD